MILEIRPWPCKPKTMCKPCLPTLKAPSQIDRSLLKISCWHRNWSCILLISIYMYCSVFLVLPTSAAQPRSGNLAAFPWGLKQAFTNLDGLLNSIPSTINTMWDLKFLKPLVPQLIIFLLLRSKKRLPTQKTPWKWKPPPRWFKGGDQQAVPRREFNRNSNSIDDATSRVTKAVAVPDPGSNLPPHTICLRRARSIY